MPFEDSGLLSEVPRHDGSILRLRKLDADYDPTDRINAVDHVARPTEKREVLSGLLHVHAEAEDLHAHLNTYRAPLNRLGEMELCSAAGVLERINTAFR